MLGAPGLAECAAPVVCGCRCLPPLSALLVGLDGAQEGLVGAVDLAGGGLSDRERVRGGEGIDGEERERSGGESERVGCKSAIG